MATLRVTSGPQAGQSLEIENELVIGRRDADLLLDDPEVSGRHAAVRPVGTGIGLRDLGSTNGTFVDGRRITEEVVLARPTTVQVGDTQITLEPTDGATVMRPVPPLADPQATALRPPPA